MTRLLLVFVAGGVGSCLRYLVGLGAQRLFGSTFPWGVLAVNIVGSFLLALVAVLAMTKSASITPTVRIALSAGFLGGLTTYSSFNQETIAMIDRRAYGIAAANVALTLLACLAAGAAGTILGRRV